ncbi:MAG TPA: hypothetical protein VHS78_16440 [Candidatus Elarobacter sp.]|nr:hypothetical protein [Candidatus Elarobacter sp.]
MNTTDTFLFAPNLNNQSYLMLGIAGTLNLTYQPGSPSPVSAYIYSPGGTQFLVVGTNQYTVNDGDYIVIDGIGASCKVEFNYI